MTFHHDASLRSYYSKGIYSAAYIETNGVLLVAGPLELDVSTESQASALII